MSRLLKLNQALLKAYPWITTPFIANAPMRLTAGPSLAVAVSSTGGLGFINSGAKATDMHRDLEEAAKLVTSTPSLKEQKLLPVGVSFLLWSDDVEDAVSAIAKFRPCAAWLYAPPNGQKDLDQWSSRIRDASPETQIWIQIGTVGEARELVKSAQRPDVVVVQGMEAGGHGRARDGMGLMALFPEVSDAMAGSEIPLLAAGGIADGRGVAAALCLGASGVVMGTRFLASTQARVAKGYQDELVRASDAAHSTTRTLLYNHLRGTFGWPEEYSPRTIINRSFIEHERGIPFEQLKKLHDELLAHAGDKAWGPEGRVATYAGASIGMIHDIKDARDILRDTQETTLKLIQG
ncbi:hypothetical protein TRVA0_019S01354 [Trichomonascus vanleenenianus]|uniref:nitronate monooxygenase n=1 Tax=Trichomonascus vanleenenianus TaxID=2268995 RepID=UPI003ECB1CB2